MTVSFLFAFTISKFLVMILIYLFHVSQVLSPGAQDMQLFQEPAPETDAC